MEIKLENIGLIKDSTIRLDGLTIITGENNSGKTTVGKAIYALVEGVTNLDERAERDQFKVIKDKLKIVQDAFSIFFGYSRQPEFTTAVFPDCPLLCKLMHTDIRYPKNLSPDLDLRGFAKDFYAEMTALNVDSINFDSDFFMRNHRLFYKFKNKEEMRDEFQYVVYEALDEIQRAFNKFEQDSKLINYTRGSINEMLNAEFHSQIQPVLYDVEKSRIEVADNGVMMFAFDIVGNKILKTDVPIFFGIPYKKALFVDNPFILDTSPSLSSWRKYHPDYYDDSDDSFLDKTKIKRHDANLYTLLRRPTNPSVLESLLAEEKYAEINQKISEVISGNIEMSADGDFYVVKGKRLHFTNLATGSKMFSILKILIDKGQIDERTLLVLDEPEAHLHPEWQNKFAEVIVLLVKYLNTNVVLTSHSPNFVMAIDAYMRKYEITDKTNFYQTRRMEDGFVEYVDVNDDLGRIYADFSQHLVKVKMLRDHHLNSGGYND